MAKILVVDDEKKMVKLLVSALETRGHEVTGVHGVPTVQLGDGPEMHEPVILQRLMECSRGARRYPIADPSYLQELFRPLTVRLA